MILLIHTALLVALTAFSTGASVLAKSPNNRLARSFAALCFVATVSFLSFFLKFAYDMPIFDHFEHFAWIWLAPVGIEIFPILLRETPPLWRFLRGLGWLLALGFTCFFLVSGMELTGFWFNVLCFSPGILLVQTVVVVVDHGLRSKLTYREGLILAGAILTLSLAPLDHLPSLGNGLPILGNLWLCGYLILFGQGITRKKLLDIPALALRFTVMTVLAVVLATFYWWVASWTKTTPAVFLLHSFAVSLGLVLLLEPLQFWVAGLTQGFFVPRRLSRFRESLKQIEQELMPLSEPARWQTQLEQSLCRAFGAASSGFVRPYSSPILSSEVSRRRAMGHSGVLSVALLESEVALATLRYEQERLDYVLSEMTRQGAEVLIPFHDSELLGWIWLQKTDEELKITPLFGGPLLAELQAFTEHLAPSLRAMLKIRTLAEQERLATLGELAAGLAHEIRNPLGAIQGAVELWSGSPASESRWTQVILDEVRRLEGLVRQFLEFSRKSDALLEELELNDWLRRVSGLFDPSVDFRLSANQSTVLADPDALLQVLKNWVRNAEQAGARKIVIGIGQAQDRKELGLFVEDDGEGVAPDLEHKIFLPFFTTRREGTGLGLSICRQIATQHGGKISLQSWPKKGSTFTLWLPQS